MPTELVPQGHRQHAGGHAANGFAQASRSAQITQKFLTCFLAMEQHGGLFATDTRVGGEQGFDLAALLTCTRVRIGQRAARAHRGASAAAHAQIGVDLDLLAIPLAADGLRRANVNACVAAGFLIA